MVQYYAHVTHILIPCQLNTQKYATFTIYQNPVTTPGGSVGQKLNTL